MSAFLCMYDVVTNFSAFFYRRYSNGRTDLPKDKIVKDLKSCGDTIPPHLLSFHGARLSQTAVMTCLRRLPQLSHSNDLAINYVRKITDKRKRDVLVSTPRQFSMHL